MSDADLIINKQHCVRQMTSTMIYESALAMSDVGIIVGKATQCQMLV